MQGRSDKLTNRVWEQQGEEKVQKGSIDERVYGLRKRFFYGTSLSS